MPFQGGIWHEVLAFFSFFFLQLLASTAFHFDLVLCFDLF